MRRCIAMLGLLACTLSAAPAWIRISSPWIEIFTDSSESTARAILHRFETLHRIFSESYGDSFLRPRVFVFASEREFGRYRPDQAAVGFYQFDEDQNFIVLYEANALTGNAAHEYLHMVMNRTSTVFPHWLEEGVSEFYSTISINGTTMRVGDPIEAHRRLLAAALWLNAEDLALGSRNDGQVFYAESWALVHMLTLSPSWSKGMPEFVKLLTEGSGQDEAFTKAFGKPMEEALKDLRLYLRSPRDLTMPAPPPEEEQAAEVRRVSPVDITLTLADLALHTDHPQLARSLFVSAAKGNPDSPAAVAGLGALALAEDRKADAQREFERAITMGSRDARTYFELAMLKNDTSLLEKAVAIDPHFAEAHYMLGTRATDKDDFRAALEHLRQAVEIQPRNFSYWYALGYAQAKSGDRHSAGESARRASATAATGQEEQMAAALTLLAEQKPTIRKEKPDVITPQSWQNRKGDTHVEGTLTQVDCDASPVRLSVSSGTPGKTIELSVQNPTEVELLNAEGVSTTLVCGIQSRPVAVDYVAATKEVTRIEFRHVVIMKR